MHALQKIVPKGKNGKLLFYGAVLIFFIFFAGQIFKIFKKLFGMVVNVAGGDTQVSIDKNNAAEQDMKEASYGFNYNSLPHPKQVYQQIADQQFAAMEYAGTDFTSLMNGVKDLTKNELMAVYYLYGLRQIATFGTTDSLKKNLMQAYADELTNWSLWGKSQVEQMQDVWNKTGLKI